MLFSFLFFLLFFLLFFPYFLLFSLLFLLFSVHLPHNFLVRFFPCFVLILAVLSSLLDSVVALVLLLYSFAFLTPLFFFFIFRLLCISLSSPLFSPFSLSLLSQPPPLPPPRSKLPLATSLNINRQQTRGHPLKKHTAEAARKTKTRRKINTKLNEM